MARQAIKQNSVHGKSHAHGLGNMSETTKDAFHKGGFEVVQPAKDGHRAGLDALLLAAAVPHSASGTLADLGAGCGTAGLAALNLNSSLDLISVEFNRHMYELLEKTMSMVANHKFRGRTKTLYADVTKSGADREKQGLKENMVDHVIMNPPYNTSNLRSSPDETRSQAHMIGEGGIDAWFRTASAITKPGGSLTMVYRSENIASILACSQGRFGGLEIIPVHSRADEPAKRLIVRSVRGSRAPLAFLPGVVVHKDDGQFTDEAEAIFNGEAHLRQ